MDTNYENILNQLISGELKEYEVTPENAFNFQAALRNFGKRKEISGAAQRNGGIVYIGLHKQ